MVKGSSCFFYLGVGLDLGRSRCIFFEATFRPRDKKSLFIGRVARARTHEARRRGFRDAATMTPHSLGVHKVLSLLTPAVRPLVNWNAERRLAAAVNVSDVRDAAKARAHKMVFDYLDAGADDEITLRRNKDAFSHIELHYRVLAGLSPPLDLSTRILGNDVDVPFFPSPTAGSKMFHRDGEAGVARAAASHGAMYCLSTMGTTSPRDVAKALEHTHTRGSGGKLFQLYVWKDRSLVRDLLAQAKAHGFRALALTVDLTWYGNRERDTRNGFTVPPRTRYGKPWTR